MTIGNCKVYRLPEIVKEMQSFRDAAEVASANLKESEAVTETNPYFIAKYEALLKLEENQNEFAEFVNNWRGVCGKCEFGA